jgi:hypothetical protein
MITRTWIRLFALLTVAGLVLAAGALPRGQAWAEPAEGPSLESIKTTLDEIEEAVGRDDVTQEALVEARQKLNTAADALRGKIDELEPRTQEAEERLKQLGPAPAKDAPPEAQEVADQRKELTESFNELDGALKQARVLSVRIEQLSATRFTPASCSPEPRARSIPSSGRTRSMPCRSKSGARGRCWKAGGTNVAAARSPPWRPSSRSASSRWRSG